MIFSIQFYGFFAIPTWFTYVVFIHIDLASIRTNTVSLSNTNSFICTSTNKNSDATIFVTSTVNAILTNSTTDHFISTRTPVIIASTGSADSSDYQSDKSAAIYPIILSSVGGGLLGLCFILCIVGLLLKRRKFYKSNKQANKFTIVTPMNSLFHRYAIYQLL